MKQILLTNDDGFESKGLLALKNALKGLARIVVVAPASEKSACGHGLSITRPLHFVQVDDDFYKLEDGTPSDCVYLALNNIYGENARPDLVISGINIGSNMGEDITYSGTAAGAMEGCLHGIDSIAISQAMRDKNLAQDFDFALACESIRALVEQIFTKGFPLEKRKFLNVNIPQIAPKQCKGTLITQMGYRIYGNEAQLHRNPRGQEYHWLGLQPLMWEARTDMPEVNGEVFSGKSDFDAIREQYVSITPIKLDLTSYEDVRGVQKWL